MKKKNVKVYIIGSGLVGRTLARQLANDGCEITIVDKDMSVLEEIGCGRFKAKVEDEVEQWRFSLSSP